MKKFALKFDGLQNYVSLGTMGTFGSNLGSGFYCKFDIRTTSTADGRWGQNNFGATVLCALAFNESSSAANISGKIRFSLRDKNGLLLNGATTNATNFNDGNKHTIEISWAAGTNVLVIKVDGASQSITYDNTSTPAIFVNFDYSFNIGCRNTAGSNQFFFPAIVDNFQIGTSPSNLYGSYYFDKFPNNCINDFSGKGNNGTLQGSPKPQIVPSLQVGFRKKGAYQRTKYDYLFQRRKFIPTVI